MKRAIFAGIVTTFVASLAFASIDLSKDENFNIEQQQDSVIEQLNLEKAKQQQVMAILQEGKEEKLRIMQEAREKIMILQQEQQARLNHIIGPEGQNMMEEIKQEKIEKHRQKTLNAQKS